MSDDDAKFNNKLRYIIYEKDFKRAFDILKHKERILYDEIIEIVFHELLSKDQTDLLFEILKRIDDLEYEKINSKYMFEYFSDLNEFDIIYMMIEDESFFMTIKWNMNEDMANRLFRKILKNPKNILRVKYASKDILKRYHDLNSLFINDNIKYETTDYGGYYELEFNNILENKQFNETIINLRIKHGIADEWATELWLIARLIEHIYYVIGDSHGEKKRFFDLLLVLPYELQMNIINKVYFMRKNFINTKSLNNK